MEIGEENYEQKLLKRINNLQKNILNFLNNKLSINLTGNEIKIDLNNKNIGNIELNLLSGIQFDNLEEINLSNNNISEIDLIKDFNLNKIKKIDLSFNNILDINSIKKNFNIISQKKINLSYNAIHNIKRINSEKKIEIILDNKIYNNEIKKDIEAIKIIIDGNNYYNLDNIVPNNGSNKMKLLNKINQLEKKILEYFNSKLNIRITGKEIILDLNNKNIDNIELDLLSGVEFKYLEEIDLSHNHISDISSLKNFEKVKYIDLSFNDINNIEPLKDILENNKQIKKINLSNNKIKNIEIIKNKILLNIIEINLDQNNLIQKDIEEIKSIVKQNRESLNLKEEEDFRNFYTINKKIEDTRFGFIYEAISKNNKEIRAIKIINKNKIRKNYKQIFFENPEEEEIEKIIKQIIPYINNMKILEDNKKKPNSVKIYEYYQTKDELAIVMELCDDNLFNVLLKKNNPFGHNIILNILNRLNKSFKIMAENKIIHGKINLNKILVKYINSEKTKFTVKLNLYSGDIFPKDKNILYTHQAPEIIMKKVNMYNEKSDLWSLGVMIYTLYFKEYPYKGENEKEMLKEFEQNTLQKALDSDLNDLIMKLLKQDPNKRITWEQYFNHSFFKKNIK